MCNTFLQLYYTHKVCIIEGREEYNLVKRRILIKKLEAAGFVFCRHGGSHDIYIRGSEIEQIPRHKEVNEQLAKAIIRKWDL